MIGFCLRQRTSEGLVEVGFDRSGLLMLHCVLGDSEEGRVFADLLRQLDSRPMARGRQFERICVWYLNNAPEYRGRFSKVWLWSDWPGAWAADAGIDLVAEEQDGRLWAIQAKAYDPSYSIKKADVDSFLSESSRPQFSYRLLVATTDRLGATARRTLDSQREPVGYLLRSQLELAQVNWPQSPDDVRPSRPARKTPFPHVREAVDAVSAGLKDAERGQLIMACGTGKTLAAMWIAERVKSARTLVLLPSLSLLAQTLREWTANAGEPFEYLAVCSDSTVVSEDELVAHTSELGLPVTTDAAVIASFLRRRGRRVVFATYQSSPQVAAAFHSRCPQFDLAIADEAHRCAGRVTSEFALVLDGRKIRARRRLFMTATPRFYTQRLRKDAGVHGVEVASMDDEERFGRILHRLTFGEAIERGLLSDYQVVVVGVDDAIYRAWAQRGTFITPDGKRITDARSLAGHIALAKTMREYRLRRVISFHSRVRAARKFSDELPFFAAWMPPGARPQGTLWSEHVSGAMTSGQRDHILLQFRELDAGQTGLLSNARCLSEGVDVPALDGVAFIDPRRSVIDVIQAVGRAIRRSPDKKLGTIVLPVFLSPDEDPDQALDRSAFSNVWEVLKALRAHDERLGQELDELRRQLGSRHVRPHRPSRIHFDVPAARVGALFVDAFNVRLVELTTESWNFSYGRLLAFVERDGHSRVLSDYRDDDGYRLGDWVAYQRQLGKTGKLRPDRQRLVENLPGWIWSTQDEDWENGYSRLLRYVQREGNARVPRRYVTEDAYRLGQWVGVRRLQRSELSPERVEALEAVAGWEWSSRVVRQANWDEGYRRLLRFAQREGHSSVASSYRDEDGYRLGRWVSYQKQLAKRRKLSKHHEQRFRGLPGWAPISKKEQNWEDAFGRLTAFVAEHGHARVPGSYRDADGFTLGAWVGKQRQYQRSGRLLARRAHRLSLLKGWAWAARRETSTWEQSYDRLLEFVNAEDHARVPGDCRTPDDFALGRWVAKQRSSQRDGRLSEARTTQLERLPNWTWSSTPVRSGGALQQNTPRVSLKERHQMMWEASFHALVGYVEREGNALVPRSYRDEDGRSLGAWVRGQQRRYREAKLSEDQQERLEALPGWAWNKNAAAWDDGYARILRTVERTGTSRISTDDRDEDGYELGRWVYAQRQAKRRGELTADRQRLLVVLPNWTWAPQDDAWEHAFARLDVFARAEGHSRVPTSYVDATGEALGLWVVHQRHLRVLGRLADERQRRLEELAGWAWDAREAVWESWYERLQAFAQREGHVRVPAASADRDGGGLRDWVLRQRQTQSKHALDPARAAKLEALPGWRWSTVRTNSKSQNQDPAHRLRI